MVIAGDGANMVGVEDEVTLVVLAKEAVPLPLAAVAALSLFAVLLVGLVDPPFWPDPAELFKTELAELFDPEPEFEP